MDEKVRRTKLPKFLVDAENFCPPKFLSAEILSDKVLEPVPKRESRKYRNWTECGDNDQFQFILMKTYSLRSLVTI